jgi:UDP-N-acetylglucosamine:LPS N-acetylglucosamine transferase
MSNKTEPFTPKLAEKTTNQIFSVKKTKRKFKSVERKEFCGISHIIGGMTSNPIVFKQNKLYLIVNMQIIEQKIIKSKFWARLTRIRFRIDSDSFPQRLKESESHEVTSMILPESTK